MVMTMGVRKNEAADPADGSDWPDCWLHGCAPWQCRLDSHDPADYGESPADYGIEEAAAA